METAAPFFADDRREARPRQGADPARRQPRPRDRRGLDRRPPAERAVRLPRPRAALRPRRGRPARAAPRRGRAARRACSSPTPASGCATTSTRSTATTPTCTRPSRPSSASPPARWRASSPSCPSTAPPPTTTRPSSARCTPGCTRSRSAPTTRSSASAAAPRRSTYTQAHRQDRHRRPSGRSRSAPATAPRSPRSTSPASARWSRASRPSALRRGYLHGIKEVIDAPGHRRAAHVIWGHSHRSGPWPERRPRRVDGGQRRAHPQHRLVGLPAALPQPASPTRSPYWPGTAVHRRRRRPAAARPPARRPRPRRAQAADRPGVKQVAWTVTPAPASSASVARGVDRVLEQRDAARLADRERARR